MRSIASRLSLFVTGSFLLAVMLFLAIGRMEYCGQPEALRSRVGAAEGPSPTLAPPLKVVFLQVESDKAGLEVGWAEN